MARGYCICEAPRDYTIPLLIVICILLILLGVLGQQGNTYHYNDNNSATKTQYIGISTDGKQG